MRGKNTDIVVILLTNARVLEHSRIFFAGHGVDNIHAFMDTTPLCSILENIDAIAAGIYSFTGNDNIPSFFGKGKIRPSNLMNTHTNLNINAVRKI